MDCKSAVVMARLVRSQDTPPNLDWWRSWLAHMPVTHGVAGSSPVQSAKFAPFVYRLGHSPFTRVRRGSIPPRSTKLSRDRVTVIQKSHKLQMVVRFRLPQPIWILFPIAGCNPVAIIKWGGWQVVRFYQGPPNIPG